MNLHIDFLTIQKLIKQPLMCTSTHNKLQIDALWFIATRLCLNEWMELNLTHTPSSSVLEVVFRIRSRLGQRHGY
jgi:hypothetical protein